MTHPDILKRLAGDTDTVSPSFVLQERIPDTSHANVQSYPSPGTYSDITSDKTHSTGPHLSHMKKRDIAF